MKLKKTLILFSLLTTLGSSTAPFLTSKTQTNNDVIIVNNEKVNLRQKAVKKANSNIINEANIETTNVDYDLRYLFGGEKNYLTYNIWDLKPTSTNSKDTSFKFICAKPVGTNLYVYVYHNDNRNGDILSATFNISKSKVQNQETGEFEENFSRYNARFINSYGYKERFMKFAIDNIISTTEDVRCYIDDCYITYQDKSTANNYYSSTYDVNDEFAFNVGSGTDFMYQYFKDDYVKITDKEVSLLLTDKDTLYNYDDYYYTNYENFYCFFNTDRNIDELIEIQYDYTLLEYDVESYTTRAKSAPDSMPTTYPKMHNVYKSLYNDFDKSKNLNREIYNFNINNTINFVNQKIGKTTNVVEVERPYFLWWKQQVKVKFDNIINCYDMSNNTSNDYKPLKDLVTSVNDKRVNENKEQFKWAFQVTQTMREVTDVKSVKTGGWWIFSSYDFHTISNCHEVKQAMITWLKFRTHNEEFEFNCLDIPTDTTSVYIANVPYETLGDIIVNKTLSGWNWLTNALNNIKNNLLPMLMSLAVIVVVVACWPVITSFTKLVGTSINMATDKKVKKKNKNKKE